MKKRRRTFGHAVLSVSTVRESADGSVNIYHGANAPAGKESNWIQTETGKGWFSILHLCDTLEPWFDKAWQHGEIKLVK
jgi:hypothetical protein